MDMILVESVFLYVKMKKLLCSLAFTWIIIIDSKVYIIYSLSLDVSLE